MEPGADQLQLVRAVCAGDREAATRFFDLLFRVAVKTAGREAGPEIANQVFLDFLERDWAPLRGWRGEGRLESWLFRIVRHQFLRRRQPALVPDAELSEIAAVEQTPLERLLQESERVALLRIVERLPVERDRVLIRKRYLQGKSSTQVALEMGIPTSLEYQIHARALKRLRKLFEGGSHSHGTRASGC